MSIKLSNMTLIAMLTSSSVTYSLRCIFACASAILIMDSICRTVMGMEPVAYENLNSFQLDYLHIKTYKDLLKGWRMVLRKLQDSETFHPISKSWNGI